MTEVRAGVLPIEFRTNVWAVFVDWLVLEHPEDVDALLFELNRGCDGCFALLPDQRRPRIIDAPLDLWRERADEFVAALTES